MKRLFFGLSIEAPWSYETCEGRLIDTQARHVTLAFLGNVDEAKLSNLPHFKCPLGSSGFFDRIFFLPEKKPRVVAPHVEWLSGSERLRSLRNTLLDFLEESDLPADRRPFFPHVTVARAPFSKEEWEDDFAPLPMITTGLHLYESLGDLRYEKIWSQELKRPFDELEHTADLAFCVRGVNLEELYVNATVAMSFEFTPFLEFGREGPFGRIDEVIFALNQSITECDKEVGCPFKAVSYHGDTQADQEGVLEWEMIVDV